MIGSAPVLSVSDFVAVFNQSLDMLYPEVVIAGELANLRISRGTWVYFDLKDEVSSVRFFGSVRSLPGPMEDGMLLEVVGRPQLHAQYGFSIQIDSVGVSGEGTINKARQLLERKLKAEGLFEPERKRALPFAPKKIGLITSGESAAYSDFMKISRERWPATEIRLFDTLVQGASAPKSLESAIAEANRDPELEVIVMIRGGGSKDDLSCFDHEMVVRAIASSRIPTLVAIGHERDLALAELAADQRASTPTNAAGLLLPSLGEELDWLEFARRNMTTVFRRYESVMTSEVESYRTRLERAVVGKIEYETQSLASLRSVLAAMDPLLPLSRGYALAYDKTGQTIKSAQGAKQAKEFALRFKDATIEVQVNDEKR